MKKSNTAERLKLLMFERKIKQIDILEKAVPFCNKYNVKLNKNDLSQYVNGKVEPGQSKLTILGLALDVSEAWLMGYDVPMERIDNVDDSINNYTNLYLTSRQKQIVKLFDILTISQQDNIIGRAELLAEQNAKSEIVHQDV